MRLFLAVDDGSGDVGSDGGDADTEMGRAKKTAISTTVAASAFNAASFLKHVLGRRSPLRPSIVYAETNQLVISVQDSGVGISAVGRLSTT